MKTETVVLMDHNTPGDSNAGLTVVFALEIPRVPGPGEILEFEGSLGGDMPVDLAMTVTDVTTKFAFGLAGFEDQICRTEVEALCTEPVYPGDVWLLLRRHPAVVWVDLGDGEGMRPTNHEVREAKA